MKKAIKKDRILIIIAVISIVVTFILCLFHIKPDWKYMFVQAVTSPMHSAGIVLKDIKDLQTMSIKISNAKAYENIDTDQSLMLVNKNNTIPENFTPDLMDYTEDVKINRCMAEAFQKLSDDVLKQFGEDLYIMSGYRTAEEQQELFDSQGDSIAESPGSSEHQTGLALDVYVNNYAGSAFLKSEIGRFVNDHCWEYGFIIRYPMLKKDITGIDFEPWHIRYVGMPHSEIIYKSGITLEEYSTLFKDGKLYEYGDYIISRQTGAELTIPKNFKSCTVSDDNTGSCYVTIRK